MLIFQFPPPRGGRLGLPARRARAWYFNSRPHAGGDGLVPTHAGSMTVFQFPPPRGGRRWHRHSRICRENFNSRPHAGGDGRRHARVDRLPYFNSRPHAGGDSKNRQKSLRFLLQVYYVCFETFQKTGGFLLKIVILPKAEDVFSHISCADCPAFGVWLASAQKNARL